mgnify:CR=1 FL=1
MNAEDFYAMFEPGLNYYLVERTSALEEIDVDHFRAALDNRLYVASEVEINIEGITPIEAPELPVEEEIDPEEPVLEIDDKI